jgi:hypothetical protein
MSIMRKALLFCVGAAAQAYDELAKLIHRQIERLGERFGPY